MKRHIVVLSTLLCVFWVLAISAHGDPPTVNTNVVNTPNVTVTNPASQPVPVTGNVGVTGTPNVSVTNTVPVVNVENPDKQEIYEEQVYFHIEPDAINNYATSNPVPPGKRLILEHVSVSAQLPSGQVPYYIEISAGGGGKTIYPFTALQGSIPGVRDYYVATLPVKLRMNAYEHITCYAYRTGTTQQAHFNFNFSGYMIDYIP